MKHRAGFSSLSHAPVDAALAKGTLRLLIELDAEVEHEQQHPSLRIVKSEF